RAYCFDIFSLFDNVYRVLGRTIKFRDPSYEKTWNVQQQNISEELPLIYLKRLLPGAEVYKSVYHKWKNDAGQTDWRETDGLLIYNDHLFIIEVKAGAFTYTSPADDLPAHLVSLKNLLEAPSRQGSRFFDYLNSASEVPISNAK